MLRAAWREAATLLLFLAVAGAETGLVGDLSGRLYTGPDPMQDAWILHTVTTRLLSDPRHLFDGGSFFPSRLSVLYSDPLLGPAILVLPLRLATANPVALYNGAVLAAMTLSSYGFYRLGFALAGNRAAALLAGVAIPYTGQQTGEIAHLNLLATSGFPFLLHGLLGLLERPGPGPAAVAGIAFGWQASTSGYHGFSCVLIVLVVAAWGWRSFREPRQRSFAAAAGLLAALLMLPYLAGFAQVQAAEASLERSLQQARHYSVAWPLGFLGTRAFAWRAWLPNTQPLFPGVVVLVFAGLAVARARRTQVALLLALAGLSFLLALGPELTLAGGQVVPLPFRWLWDHVPFFSAARHPFTFAFPGMMALGLLAALGFAGSAAARRPALAFSVLLLAFAETLVPWRAREDKRAPLPDVYAHLRSLEPGAVLELPEDAPAQQWWSIQHGRPIVWGAGAFWPERTSILWQRIRKEWRRRPVADLSDVPSLTYLKTHFPARYLVLHRGGSGYVFANVERTQDSFELLHETAQGDRVYRIRRSGSGRTLRRYFRDDQLSGGRVWAVFEGPAGSSVAADLNGIGLGRHALAAEPVRLEWRLPAGSLRRGLNLVTFELGDAAAAAELALRDCGGA